MNAPLSGLAADPVTVLRGHFAAAVALLRASEPRHLDGAQRLVRKLLLDAIEGYAYRGVLPRNRHFPGERQPTLLLSAGPRACADYLRSLYQRWDETGRDIDPVHARCRPGIPEAVVSPGRSCTLEPAPLASSESLSLLALVLATLAARRLVRG